jgi:hypothetical protein
MLVLQVVMVFFSLFLVAKCSDDGRNRQGKSNKGACKTANSPPNINPTDEANAPLIYAAISAKCSDDGQSEHF